MNQTFLIYYFVWIIFYIWKYIEEQPIQKYHKTIGLKQWVIAIIIHINTPLVGVCYNSSWTANACRSTFKCKWPWSLVSLCNLSRSQYRIRNFKLTQRHIPMRRASIIFWCCPGGTPPWRRSRSWCKSFCRFPQRCWQVQWWSRFSVEALMNGCW